MSKLFNISKMSSKIFLLNIDTLKKLSSRRCQCTLQKSNKICHDNKSGSASGWNNILNSYWVSIDHSKSNLCLQCGQSSYNTLHIFKCPANLTLLDPYEFVETPNRSGSISRTWPPQKKNLPIMLLLKQTTTSIQEEWI